MRLVQLNNSILTLVNFNYLQLKSPCVARSFGTDLGEDGDEADSLGPGLIFPFQVLLQ